MTVIEDLESEVHTLVLGSSTAISRPSSAYASESIKFHTAPLIEPRITVLRPRSKTSAKKVADATEVRIQRFLEDERRGFIAQSESLRDRYPDSAIAWSRLAQTFAGNGDFGKAAEAAGEALRLVILEYRKNGTCSSALEVSGFVAMRILISSNRETEVERFLGEMNEPPGSWKILYASLSEQRGDYGQALARLKNTQGPEFDGFRGYLNLKLGEWRRAINCFRDAGGEGSHDPFLLVNLAYAYSLAGSQKKAIKSARQASLLAPSNRQVALNLLGHLMNNGRSGEALKEARKFQRAGIEDIRVSSIIGYILANEGMLAEARREIRRALNENQFRQGTVEYSELSFNLSLIESRMGLKNHSDLISDLRRQIRASNGRSVPLVVLLGNLAHTTAIVPEVESLYDSLQAIESEETLLALRVCLDLLKLDVDAALLNCEKWVVAAPLNHDAYQNLMTIYGHFERRFADAIKVGQRALKIFPASHVIRNTVAFYLALEGKAREARDILKECREDTPMIVATRGLIAFSEGQIQSGLDLYDEATNAAASKPEIQGGMPEFESLARIYEWIGLQYFHHFASVELKDLIPIDLPGDWSTNTSFLHAQIFASCIGVDWPSDLSDS